MRTMGFKKVDHIPDQVRKGTSIYLPILREVEKTGDIYALDLKDNKRSHTLAATLRNIIQKHKVEAKVVVRDTAVYICK